MLFGQTDEVVGADWGDEDWVNCDDSSSFASPVPGFPLQPPDIFFPHCQFHHRDKYNSDRIQASICRRLAE
jgi:hypothetical protein